MGNQNSCCVYASPHTDRKSKEIPPVFEERHNVYNHHHYQQQQLQNHHQQQQQQQHHLQHLHQQQQHHVHPHHHHHQQQQQQQVHHHSHGTVIAGAGSVSRSYQLDAAHHIASTAAIHHHSAENFDNSQTLQHISEREALEGEEDPSVDPTAATMFLERSKVENGGITRKRSQHQIVQQNSTGGLKKSSSCSTIYLDDSTVSQPNLKNTVKCVSLAIYYHIKNRQSDRRLDIFDEKLHPLTNDLVPNEYDIHNPEHRQIYKFVRTLFNAAQLTAECAIITLVYLERLLTYAELDVAPSNWKRMVLGNSIL